MTNTSVYMGAATALCAAVSVHAGTFEVNLPGLEVQYGGFIGSTFHETVADLEREFVSIESAHIHIEATGDRFLPELMDLGVLGFLDGAKALPGQMVQSEMGSLVLDVPLVPALDGSPLLDGIATIGLNINVLTCCDIPFVVNSATLVVEGTQKELFKDCGTLIQGVECVLFAADSGGEYILSDLGGFSVGDEVRVEGILDPFCISFCLQGDGCIFDNTIGPCCPEDLDGDGVVGPADLALLLGAWGLCSNVGPCPADLTSDGFVNAADLAQLLGNWGDC